MMQLHTTQFFIEWISSLDRSVRIRVDQRLQRLADGNAGFHRRFDQILEIKWSTGQMGSFRVYCMERNGVILLLGGDKGTQSKDIAHAKEIMKGVLSENIRTEIYE